MKIPERVDREVASKLDYQVTILITLPINVGSEQTASCKL